MSQPTRYVHPSFPDYVCKLNKAICGLKQAPRVWNTTLSTELLHLGFVNSRCDSSLFIFRNTEPIILFLVYVDDVIITGNNPAIIDTLMKSLDKKFALKSLGQLQYFLGIQVHYLDSRFIINQAKYVDGLLYKLQLTNLKLAPSPSVLGKHLSLGEGTPLVDPFIFRSTIGALQYLTNTRPDISYIVNHPNQFLQKPTDLHWQAVRIILRYISGIKHCGLLFKPSIDLSINAYSDADYSSNIDDRKFVVAYCVFVGNNPVSWSSKKQTTVARSSTESEYKALTHAASEIIWLKQLLCEL